MTISGRFKKSKISVYLLSGFYAVAGINHLINPEFYLGLIPAYFTTPHLINQFSGMAEIILAIGVLFPLTRKLASYAIILMLIAFIPSHIYFIQIGSCVAGGLCVSPWLAWVRLIIIHPLLILWAYKVSKLRGELQLIKKD